MFTPTLNYPQNASFLFGPFHSHLGIPSGRCFPSKWKPSIPTTIKRRSQTKRKLRSYPGVGTSNEIQVRLSMSGVSSLDAGLPWNQHLGSHNFPIHFHQLCQTSSMVSKTFLFDLAFLASETQDDKRWHLFLTTAKLTKSEKEVIR